MSGLTRGSHMHEWAHAQLWGPICASGLTQESWGAICASRITQDSSGVPSARAGSHNSSGLPSAGAGSRRTALGCDLPKRAHAGQLWGAICASRLTRALSARAGSHRCHLCEWAHAGCASESASGPFAPRDLPQIQQRDLPPNRPADLLLQIGRPLALREPARTDRALELSLMSPLALRLG